jgi:hypothetical protein
MARPPEGNELIPGQGGGYKSPQLKKHLWPHHIHMARMVATGATSSEIQVATGFSAGQISRIFGSPLFQAEVARLTDTIDEVAVYQVQEQLKQMSGRAIEVLDEDLNRPATTPQERQLRQRAAFDILDRAGYGKREDPQLHLHAHKHFVKDAEEMETQELLADVLDLASGE